MKLFYILFFLLCRTIHLFAQSDPVVSGDFTGAAFQEFVTAVEQQTSLRFYFKPGTVDSVAVNVQAEKKSIRLLLEEIFAGTDLNFAVEDNNIYISKTRKILTSLPPGFYGEAVTEGRSDKNFDYSDYERKEKEKKPAEAKRYIIGTRNAGLTGSATLAGNVRNATNGEPVIGAIVFTEKGSGVGTDQFGFYSLTLPKGEHELRVQSVGMESTQRKITLYSDGKLDIEIDEKVTALKEVVVESEKDVRLVGVQMGLEKLDIKTMKQIPLALGETDIMKVVLTLPGVQTVGEGTVGLNIRGGASNQNLILFNDAVVYNPSHLFGFFSTFNPDVLQNVELYKSGIGAEFGGRLSAVLDVHSREGNTKKISGSGGLSPITGRLTLEGPIIKDKTSFLVGARSTYSNWLMKQFNVKELENSTANFYDLNAQLTHKIDDNNNLYVSGYTSKDNFRLNSDTLYTYTDQNASLKWKHIFNNKLFGVLCSSFSNYKFSVTSDKFPVNAFTLGFSIQQLSAKADFNFFPNARHTVNAGMSTIRYSLAPGDRKPKGETSEVVEDVIQHERG